MATNNVPLILKGLSAGFNSERSVMTILPTALESTSRNVDILRDGSFQPRRGIDFVGLSTSAAYIHSIRSATVSAEPDQESPSAIYAQFKTSDGEVVEKDVIFQDLVFKVFNHTNLNNFDSPDQTINPSARVGSEQKYHNVAMVFGDNKIFFAGKHLQPGYLYLSSDNTTLVVKYLSIHTRDLYNATAASSRVKLNGKYYECIEAHTAATSHLTDLDSYGELVFNRYWMELDNSAIPGGAATWTNGVAYTTNIVRDSSKYAALAGINPHTVDFWGNRLWLGTDGKIYYSQVAVDVEDAKTSTTPSGTHEYGLFLTEGDPFNTTDPDPGAADGGTITPDAGKVWQIISADDSMFVGTSSQIEEIRGATTSFKHTDFKKERVINEGVNGVDNMVAADNRLYVFGNNNIWAAVTEQRASQAATTQFAKFGSKKVKTYYTAIPKLNKGTARAVYSPTKEKIYYFHNATATTFDAVARSIAGQNGYASSIMVLDISGTIQDLDPSQEPFVQNQVVIWDYADTAHIGDPYIAYGFTAAPTNPSVDTIVVGADTVVVGADTVVRSGLSGSQEGSDAICVIAMQRTVVSSNVSIKAGVAILESTQLKDWYSDVDLRTDYTANADMGTQTFEDVTSVKAMKYLVFVFEKLTDGTGSCLCRTAFNFSNPTLAGEDTGKTSGQTEVYKDSRTVGESGTVSMTNYKATYYKHKVRGRGLAFQISLESTPGKDFKLLGWGQLVKMVRR